MEYLNDHWTNQIHYLHYESFALHVRDLILTVPTPFALSIGGRWGMGKTSTLRALMESLGGEPLKSRVGFHTIQEPDREALHKTLVLESTRKKGVKTVWFNPWQYQGENNPLIPLLHEIRTQIRPATGTVEKLTGAAKNAWEASMHSFGSLVDSTINLGLGRKVVDFGSQLTSQLEKIHQREQQQTLAEPIDAQRFFLLFEKAVEQALSVKLKRKLKEEDRLVIFLDDLDRCSDQVVFSLLESIKLYLCSHRCVFVFGMDRAHVETAVERAGQYSQREAAHYIDKLFQAQISLPIPTKDAVQTFLSLQADKIKSSDFTLATDELELLAEVLPANPRLMKNVLNELKFYHNVCLAQNKDNATFNNISFILVHLLRTFFPDAYELFFQDGKTVFLVLKKFETGGVDYSNNLEAYLHSVMENPIITTLQTESAETPKPMEEERFRTIRTSAWKAKAISHFLTRFNQHFDDFEELQEYLI